MATEKKKIVINPNIYKKFEHREHVYKVPDTYIGSVRSEERNEWILVPNDPDSKGNSKGFKMRAVQKTITFPVGAERIFIEILSNAGDNVPRSLKEGLDPGKIEVIMNKDTIIVKNSGCPIPIALNTEFNQLAPDMIFGDLLSSSNYEGEREGAGRNGYGSKLSNIFSKEFTVMIGDSGHEKEYKRTWRNNLTESDPPTIIDNYTGNNYVIVMYKMDFERFGLSNCYSDEVFALFARLCADLAFTQNIPVEFNGQEFYFKKPEDFASIYFGDNIEHGFLMYLWPQGTQLMKKGRTYMAVDQKVKPIAKIYLVDTPQDNSLLSFVNGMMTRDGGVHVDGLMTIFSKMILGELKNQVNGTNNTKDKNGKNGKPKAKKEQKERFPLDVRDVKSSLSMIASFHLLNPEFTSQTKTRLAFPQPYVHIESDALQPIYKWKIMDRLYFLMAMKDEKKLAGTDGRKKRFIGPAQVDDCNWAGTAKSHECTLMLVEGKSAMGYGIHARDAIPNGNDVLGVLPLKGKMLNVMNASAKKILKNNEVIEIKKALGLEEGTDYSLQENANRLRYGKVLLAADADDDGIHIKGLAVNYFFTRFKTLFNLPKGFIFELILPILRMYHGKDVHSFYTFRQYHEFVSKNPGSEKWKVKYFKGLGNSSKDIVKEDFKNPRMSCLMLDDTGPAALQLGFDRRYSDNRKEWLSKYVDNGDSEYTQIKKISDFINNDLIRFSLADLARSVPKFMDGLKTGQRKILWAAFKKWPKWYIKEDAKEQPVTGFAGYVKENTRYHHGDSSLEQTIIAMAHDFVGSNNLPYFVQDGLFGSRYEGGKDRSASRYLSTKLQWWIPYVFRHEDFPLLKLIHEEGTEIEPEEFYPIIPLTLINGMNGIGTAYSTFIPNHNPIDVIQWYKMRILGQPLPDVYPWYKGFKGLLELVDRNTKKRIIISPTKIIKDDHVPTPIEGSDQEGETDNPDGEDIDAQANNDQENEDPEEPGDLTPEPAKTEGNPRISLITKGLFTYDRGVITVTELPIGRWTKIHSTWLESLVINKKIKSYRKLGEIENPGYEIVGFEEPEEKKLKLVKSYGMTNMVLLSNKGIPIKFGCVDQILEAFYQMRKVIYADRKKYMLENMLNEIHKADTKRKFISLVAIEKKIEIRQRPAKDIYQDMDQYNLPHELYKTIKAYALNQDSIDKLTQKIKKLQEEYQQLEKTSPEEIWYRELVEFEELLRAHEIKDEKQEKKNVKIRLRRTKKTGSQIEDNSRATPGSVASSNPTTPKSD